jgi:hypothetical protein
MVAFAPNQGETSGMKAKAVNHSLLVASIRPPRPKESALMSPEPLSRPRPFLSQTLRLRVRYSPRG